jgi:hypothetical protein
MRAVDAKLRSMPTIRGGFTSQLTLASGKAEEPVRTTFIAARDGRYSALSTNPCFGTPTLEGKICPAQEVWDGAYILRYNDVDTTFGVRYRTGETSAHLSPGPVGSYINSTRYLIQAGEWNLGRIDDPTFRGLDLLADTSIEGRTYHVVRWSYIPSASTVKDDRVDSMYFYVGNDSLIHRMIKKANGSVHAFILDSLAAGGEPDSATFTTAIPPRYTFKAYPDRESQVGMQGPAFALADAYDRPQTLESILAGKKAVILWQWSYY